jgi:hypothetical protein
MNGIVTRSTPLLASLFLAWTLVTPAGAATARHPSYRGKGNMLSTTQDGLRVSGYLALPKGAGTHPGIVVI